MIDIITNVVAFIVALGVLITFHEFGHYWVARKCGVKVLRFSIGFGTPLWKRRGGSDNTEYVVAAIPLGGYVKMLDEREGDVDPNERQRAFNTQSVGKRIAIVAAGPLANFLLAAVLYWLMFIIGISGIVPIVGTVATDSVAARAGIVEQDKIVAVDGDAVESWDGVRFALLDSSMGSNEPVLFDVVDRDGFQAQRIIREDFSHLLKDDGDLVRNIGLSYWWPRIDPIVAGVQDDSPAQRAGLSAGDRFVSLDGEVVDDWIDLVNKVRLLPNQQVEAEVIRDGQSVILAITPAAKKQGDSIVGHIGAWEDQSALLREKMRATTRYGVFDSAVAAVERSWEMSALTVQMLAKLITGQAALSNISGPVTIAQFAGQSASIGLDHYLNFLAIISISLGILNLLPVPVLDGGHLLFFAIEWIKGSPLSESIQLFGQQVGIVLLGGLMCLAFYNDIWRLMQ